LIVEKKTVKGYFFFMAVRSRKGAFFASFRTSGRSGIKLCTNIFAKYKYLLSGIALETEGTECYDTAGQN
jgi:hypothetical protein